MTVKEQILNRLYEELKSAADKENNAQMLKDSKWADEARGYVNGVLEAIDIVKRIKED